MKSLALTALLFASVSAYSASPFTAAQEKKVLKSIDNICGDTWCEGDYNFRFNSFKCDKKSFSCELNFQFIKTDDEGKNETLSSEQVCHFDNIRSFNQLMDNKWELADEFYSAVTDCIWEKEKSVRF